MKQQVTHTDASLPGIKQIKHSLYTNYAGMLFGYICEAIKDPTLAEQYLIELFNDLQPADLEVITAPGTNAFCQLQLYTRKKIAGYISSINTLESKDNAHPAVNNISNKFIDRMSREQQLVFCGIHYHGKSTAVLAAELNLPETAIRQLLKDSFIIIRNIPQ